MAANWALLMRFTFRLDQLNAIRAVLWLLGLFLICSSPRVWAADASLTDVTVNAVSDGRIRIDFEFNKPITVPKNFKTENPARIVLDFQGIESKVNETITPLGIISSINLVSANDRLRAVVNLKEQINYTVLPGMTPDNQNHIYLTLESKLVPKINFTKDKFSANTWSKTHHEMQGIDFRRDEDGGGRVVIQLSDASMGINVTKSSNTIQVEFLDTFVPDRLKRRLDVTDFGTPVQSIQTQGRAGNVAVAITATGSYQHLAYQVNDKFIVDVSPEQEAVGIAGEDEEEHYTGERLSLNFQDIPVRAVLQLLAEFTGINIVASDSVRGNITLRLNNIPWDEALAIILRTQGLTKREVGSVLMIAPSEEVAAREKEDLESRKEVKALEPLTTELIRLNYAKAADISTLLKDKSASLLTARGNVTVDTRTNTLLIQDTLESVIRAQELITRLDIPVKQVLIEARIVNVDTNFEKDLGIQFGATKPNHVSGTLDGSNLMQSNVLNGDNPLLNVPVADRLNVNLPAAPEAGVAGSIGIALARLGRGYLLDLEISALESEGAGELISSPRLVTADQEEAFIEQGEEIPYQEATSSGATSVEFKKAVLALRVTPQITPDGNVIL